MGPTSSVQPHSWILQTSEIGQSAWCHHCPGEGRAPSAGMGERCLSAVLGHVVLPAAPACLCSRRRQCVHGGGTDVQGTRLILQIPQYHGSVPVFHSSDTYFEVVVLEYHQLGCCVLHSGVIPHVTPDYVVVRDEKANVSPPYRVKSRREAR